MVCEENFTNGEALSSRIKELDLHGYLVAEAEEIFYQHLNKTRLKKGFLEVKFVTGPAKIRQRFVELCEEHQLEYLIPVHNPGMIHVYFE